MAFRFRKKNKEREEAPVQALQPPLTLILTLNENYDAENLSALLAALPENAEILVLSDLKELPEDIHAPEGRTLRFSKTRDAHTEGKYVLEADAADTFDEQTASELFGAICSAQTDLLFYGANEKKRGAAAGDPLTKVLENERPLPLRTAVCGKVAKRAGESGLIRRYREIFIPLLFGESAQSLPLEPLRTARTPKSENNFPDPEQVLALAAFFNTVKPSLDTPRYRFGFNYVCDELILAAARLAASGDKTALADFDARIKGMNMALWVAVAEKSPLSFMKTLRKKNYSLSFPLKTYFKAYTALHP